MTVGETPSLFIEVRNWLEIFYFISGILLMFLAGFGLWQIKLAKEQLETSKNIFKTQSKRASVEAAVVECRNFSETVVLDSLALDKYCLENEISFFDDVTFEHTADGFRVNADKASKEDADKLMGAEEILNKFMNGMEAHALFFLSGVADENIAFHTNAKTYLELAQTAFKVIPLCSLGKEDIKPIKSLYFLWHEKYEANKLKVKKKEIETELANHSERNIRAIGT